MTTYITQKVKDLQNEKLETFTHSDSHSNLLSSPHFFHFFFQLSSIRPLNLPEDNTLQTLSGLAPALVSTLASW